VADSLAAGSHASVDLSPADHDAFATALTGMTLNQARQALARVAIEDGRLHAGDLPRLVDLKARALKDDGLLEYWPPADNPAELGGFASLRRWLDRARIGFSPEAAAMNITPPRGVMLVGVQGCGKSLAAKFVARSWGLPLLKLDMGRLFDKYIGESEKNFRRAIATAEGLAPAVLWLDEIEKALATGSGEGDGGLGRRMFGSFLTWLQEKEAEVFVVATANDLSALPPELLRKGRFDEIFFVDLPDPDERQQIFRIHLALRNQNPAAFDVAALSRTAEGFSGAEIEQAVISAALQALHERRPLDTEIVTREIGATVPLSRSRAEDVATLRAYAAERFVPVR
jgi:MoxR-like ATPase